MKKLLVFVLACLSSTVMFAQTHYTIVTQGVAAAYTKVNGYLVIDGEEQFNPNLEIGAFDQNGICREARMPQLFPRTGKYIYAMQLRGNTDTDEQTVYTFKVWDHETDTEMDLTCEVVDDNGEPIVYQGNFIYKHNGSNSSAMNPMPLNFTSNGPATQTFTKDITGYGEFAGNLGYYFIATPVNGVNPEEVEGMTYPEGDDYDKFDLYSFNPENEGEEWRNYKDGQFTTLALGSGYLYANMNDVTLTVSGIPSTDGTVELTPDEGHTWSNWCLVGNPLGVPATIGQPCYTLNGGDDYVTLDAGAPIEVMQGVLIENTEGLDNLVFTPQDSEKKSSNLSLNVTSESKLVDRAIVNFNNVRNLKKITFRENKSKIYMTQDSKDYAVLYSEGQGEMPVSFKAEKNGTYNIGFTAENAEFSYLHLIDNMTGNDVDLLVTPSYTFDANTTDYASRFRLVFAKSGSNNGNDFGFVSNGNLMVLGIEGEATLQVIDVTGRVLSSETFSGSYSKAVNASAGVYMIRLVQGNDVRTQKIVVR